MADQKVSARTESTDTSTELYVHVIQDGDSYKQARTNLLKPVQDQIDDLPVWHSITGQSLSAGNNNKDTGQSTIEPEDIKIIDPASNNIDITKEFTVGHVSSGNWIITVYSSVPRTGLTIKWFGVILSEIRNCLEIPFSCQKWKS